MSLGKRLSIVTVVAVVLFVGGVLAFQLLAENKVLASEVTEAGNDEEIMSIEDMNKLTIDSFVVDLLGYDSQICKEFSSKYGIDSASISVEELSSEQYIYLNALITIYQNSSNPILARNEEIKDGQVILNEDGEYMYSLETQLTDVNAISNDIDTTTAIIEIIEKYGLDPDGKIEDLTPEIIIEIDDKLFEISDHPKN